MRRIVFFAVFYVSLIISVVKLSSAVPQVQPSIDQAAKAILENNCTSCHGATQMSGLDLRQRETILKGGKRGPAVIPGKAEESLLYLAVTHAGELKMPPPGDKRLPEDEIETLKRWINEGAPLSSALTTQKSEPSWWSFRKLRRPQVPKIKNEKWARNPIDVFVLAKLEEKGLTPAPAADKRTLIRRAYFDLIGLPPTFEQVESFVRDTSPDAYEKLIDQLLKSPHYGERWGRHWLDVVRYADSGGYETDIYYRNAWRYRDYVIKSFNDDKPYDRFLQEQIAGDELWPDNLDLHGSYDIPPNKLAHLEAQMGTGLYTLGPEIHESNMDAKKLLNEKLTDWVDTTGSVFMGVTLSCARCHDHKFDPFSQLDYYRFQAIFAGSKEVEIPMVSKMSIADHRQHYPRLIAVHESRRVYRLFEEKIKERAIKAKKAEFPPEVVAAYETPEDERTLRQKELAAKLAEAINSINIDEVMTAEERQQQGKLYEKLAKAVLALPEKDAQKIVFDGLMEVPTASVLGHHEPELVPEIYVLDRGDLGREKEKAEPGLPTVLDDGTYQLEPFSGTFVPRNRKMLALWLSRPDHPLTARVMVNRIWQWHFGQGIVNTPNDFGKQGQPPTHPELLDWLATEFVARNWSIKSMHRLIMLSNTYQMSSQYYNEKNARMDPDNRYLWRMNRKRLEGEALWDAMHAAAGTLNLKLGGPPVVPPLSEDELTSLNAKWQWPVSADPKEHSRRGVYILVRRNFRFPMFEAFDAPINSVSCPQREMTTVTPQALWFLNNRIAFQQAQEFAARLVRENGDNPPAWIESAWRIALGRAPSDEEKQEALELIESLAQREVKIEAMKEDGKVEGSAQKDSKVEEPTKLPAELAKISPARAMALSKFCLAIFNLNEFAYID